MTEKILALANPMLCTVFALAFFILWWRERSVKWIAIIAATYFTRAIGFFVFHFTGDPNGVGSIVMMHLFYSASAITVVWGVCERNGQKADLGIYTLIAAGGMAMMVAASYGVDYNARLYAANASYGLILALGTQTAARKVEKDLLDKAILFLLGMGAFQFFFRPLMAIMVEGSMTAEQYRETPFYAVMVVWLALASLLMAMALLIAALTDQMKTMRENSERDALTSLKMRGPFEQAAVAMLNKAKEEGVQVSVIVADIDHFKQVNDIWGHQVGDNAIASFGKLLQGAIRPTDIVGRIGGEEFCLLVWNCPIDPTKNLAERIRARFADLRITGISDDVRISASFGVAGWDRKEGYGKLFARADAALYAAKKSGRNRVVSEGWDADEDTEVALGEQEQKIASFRQLESGPESEPQGPRAASA